MRLRGASRVLGIALAVAAVLTLGGLGFRYGIRDQIIPRNFDVVSSGKVYRSGRLTPAMTEKVVRENGIRTIVDLGAFSQPADQRVAAQTAEALGVRRHVFALEGDGTGDPQMYVDALRIIADPANQPVLVHCAAGSERTSACVMMYRKGYEGVGFDQSFHEALEHKHRPQRNPAMRPYVEQWGDRIIEAAKSGRPLDQQAK